MENRLLESKPHLRRTQEGFKNEGRKYRDRDNAAAKDHREEYLKPQKLGSKEARAGNWEWKITKMLRSHCELI